jgi:hypothetical protein
MGSNTLGDPGLYQRLAHAAREIADVPIAILTRLDHDSMLVRTVTISPVHGTADAALWQPVRTDSNRHLRRIYVDGRPVSASLGVLRNAIALPRRRSRAAQVSTNYATILPLRTRRGIVGALALFGTRRASAPALRRYENIAGLVSLALQLAEGAQESVMAGERARKEAAAVLHGTQAALIAIRYRLGESRTLRGTDPAKADAIVDSARDELERIGERDIGRTSRLLYPLVIRMSLAPALEALAERYAPRVKIALRIDPAVGKMDDPFQNRLPEGLRLAVYRAAEAAVASAAAHGSVAPIEVSLTRSAGPALVLRVRQISNGLHIPATPWTYPEDLAVRVDEWGGRLSMRRRTGVTILSASFPMPAPDDTA